MAKNFKDFTFLGKKLSELNGHYVSVDFNQNPDSAFAFGRDINYGDTNRYRTEPNVGYSYLSDKLQFELHLVKDEEYLETPSEALFTDADIREITRWLTSTSSSEYLAFDYADDEYYCTPYYYGQFSDIKPFNVNGDVYGLILVFECSTPYGYTDEIVDTFSCREGISRYTLYNQDDRLNDYCYPTLHITSNMTGDIFFCNLSDCEIHKQGTLPVKTTENNASVFMTSLQEQIDEYALAKGYATEYVLDDTGAVSTLCSNTAVPFTFRTSSGQTMKCMAFYDASTLEYFIIQGGFLHIRLLAKLPVHINAEKLLLFDDLNRMIKLSDLGVDDVDYMYFPRLLNGENHLSAWGADCTFTIIHRETRKAGA